jgi:hypothetical protein
MAGEIASAQVLYLAAAILWIAGVLIVVARKLS